MIVVLLVASVMGAIGIYFIYNNQYIKFQDETIQKVILETLNEKENKILKGKEKEIEIVYVNELLSDISTLEDLEMFPKLSEVSFMWEANYETEEERINFEERWKVTKEDEDLLASCYTECLKLAADTGVESIAFCCLSTGVFRFPQQRAAEIATSTVKQYLNKDSRIKKVIFNVFKDEDLKIYSGLL